MYTTLLLVKYVNQIKITELLLLPDTNILLYRKIENKSLMRSTTHLLLRNLLFCDSLECNFVQSLQQ